MRRVLRVDPRCGMSRAPGDVRVAPSTFLVPAFAICLRRPGGCRGRSRAASTLVRCTARILGRTRRSHLHRAYQRTGRILGGSPCGLSDPRPCPPPEPGIGWIAPGGRGADAPQVSATAPLGASERIRVLVVDDNDGFRESLVFLLSGEDLEVIGQARTGPEAVEMTVRLMPDVVLMDVRMPEMDGIEATRRLKAARPTVGVVALSSMEEQRA